jgi:S1-C subfamily serine protease/thiol-disulfide isomerase/thioredoxin
MSKQQTPIWVWFAVGNILFLAVATGVVAYVVSSGKNDNSTVLKNDEKVKINDPTAIPPQDGKSAEDKSEKSESEDNKSNDDVKPSPAETEAPKEEPLPPPPPPKVLTPAEVIQRVDHGVLLLTCLNSAGDEIGFGSGFVINDQGFVATNYHVIGSASSIVATTVDGTKIKVKGCRVWDDETDLAILELAERPAELKVLPLNQSTTREQGSEVIAIGHPQGFQFATTSGIISAVRTTSKLPSPYRDQIFAPADNIWIQTNAAISGGNSGGPLLDLYGEVVGINTWIAEGSNLGFAIDVRHLVDLSKKTLNEAVALEELTGLQEKLAEIVTAFQTQYAYFNQELANEIRRLQEGENAGDAKKLEGELKKWIAEQHPAIDYLPKFVKFAEQHHGKPASLQALQYASMIAADPRCPESCSEQYRVAADRLVDGSRNDPRILSLVLRLGGTQLDSARYLLRRLSKESTNRKIQAASYYSLATLLVAKEDPAQPDEAIGILELLLKDYGDVVLGRAELSKLVEPMLDVEKHFKVGKTPPDIQGEDQDGQTFRLSDYRGKIVVVDFWADWCPHCVAMYPLERKLVEEYADQPFVLLGVNGDEPARFERLISKKNVTWRNWPDGPNGPITQAWHVTSFPTLYVLDHEGVIRYKDVRGDDLVAAIKELMPKVPKVEGATPTEEKPTSESPAKEDDSKEGNGTEEKDNQKDEPAKEDSQKKEDAPTDSKEEPTPEPQVEAKEGN